MAPAAACRVTTAPVEVAAQAEAAAPRVVAAEEEVYYGGGGSGGAYYGCCTGGGGGGNDAQNGDYLAETWTFVAAGPVSKVTFTSEDRKGSSCGVVVAGIAITKK
jgi:uncharacterized membrane protein